MSTPENIESFSALIDQTIAAFPAAGAGSRDWAAQLLSPERAQRFELVMHLIANLAQPLVVCGPDGVGKTTFLGLLAERAFEGWRVVNLSADGPWTHGDIIARIAERLALPSTTEKAVADYLQQQPPNKSALVLSLDEAGKLAPGVIDSLWQFARTYPALRVVLALSPDEIHLKNTTDSVALGDSRFVDIPPLTEAACEAFLRRLSVRPPRLLLPEEVTASRARSLYQASHGVPGRIIQLLNKKTPTRTTGGSNTSMRLAYSLAATALVFAVVLVYAWRHGTTPPPIAQLKPPQAVPPQPLALHTPPAAPTQSAAKPPAPASEAILQQPAPDKPVAPAETAKVAEAVLPATSTAPQPATVLPAAQEQPAVAPDSAKAVAAPAPISTATPPQPTPLPAIPIQPAAPAAPLETTKAAEAATVSQPPAVVPVASDKPVAPIETVKAAAPVANPAAPLAPANITPPPVAAVTPPATPPPPAAVAAPKATPHTETAAADSKPAPAKKAATAPAPSGVETVKPVQPAVKKAEIKPPALPAPLPTPAPLKPQAPAPKLPPPPIALTTPKPAPVPPTPPPALQTRVNTPVAGSEARPAAPPPVQEKPARDVAEDVWSDDDAPVKEIASYKSKLWAFRDDAPAPSANRTTAAPASAAAAVNPAATYGRPQKSPSADALPTPVVVDPGNYVAGEAAETAPVVVAVPYTAPISPPRPVAPPPPQPMAAAAPAAKTPALPATGAGLPGADWLLTQPSQAYTLRIMSARDPASVRALLERYPAMRGRLATLKGHNGAMEMYTVYYGTFATQAEANQAAAALPAFLGKPVPRQLHLIQQEARSPQRGGTGR
ncbi:MAG: hypothetical protein EPN21_16280 [Methylococcaceae bacterium]|nr:MAG: hypothetical protein EPN21_16280 [Methylococcaceae bacterium]